MKRHFFKNMIEGKCRALSSIVAFLVLLDNNPMQNNGVLGLVAPSSLSTHRCLHSSESCNREQWKITSSVLHHHERQSQSSSSNNKNVQKMSPQRRQRSSTTSLYLFGKIAQSLQTIEEEYDREIKQASLSPMDVFLKEGEESSDISEAFRLMKERMAATTGDTETKLQLLEPRNYANGELLDKDHLTIAPNLDDLNQPPSVKKLDRLWISPPFRMSVIVGAYLIFPFLQKLCNFVITVESTDEFNMVTSQFAPGIGVLYGTIVALTLDILYERESRIQENITLEAGLLSQITQHLLSLFDSTNDTDMARETSQLVAEQVRMISTRTRGAELLSIMRADPYAQILGLVDEYHLENGYEFTPQQNSLTECLRQEIPQIMEARAKRLSDEASSLPPTHFLVLSILTALILVGYTVATLTVVDENGAPSQESQVVFAGLTAIYVLFYNFCKDLNSPFDGVYQIKRSSAASYLLQVKWLISNQSFGNEIVFDDVHPVFKETGALLQNDVTVFGETVVAREDLDELQRQKERKKQLRQQTRKVASASSADFSSTRKRRRRGREMRARLNRGARDLATDILRSFKFEIEGAETAAATAGRRYRQKRKQVIQRRKERDRVADDVEKRVKEARRLAKERQAKKLMEQKEVGKKVASKLKNQGEKPLTVDLAESISWTDGSEPLARKKKVEMKASKVESSGDVATIAKKRAQQQKTGGASPSFKVAWNDPSPAERRKMAAMSKDKAFPPSPPSSQTPQFEFAEKAGTILTPCDDYDEKWSDLALCTTSLSTAQAILHATTGTPTSSSSKASLATDYFRRIGGTNKPMPTSPLTQFPLSSLSTTNGQVASSWIGVTEKESTTMRIEDESDAVKYFRSVGGGGASPTEAPRKTTVTFTSSNADNIDKNTPLEKTDEDRREEATSEDVTEKEDKVESAGIENELTAPMPTEAASTVNFGNNDEGELREEEDPSNAAPQYDDAIDMPSSSNETSSASLVDVEDTLQAGTCDGLGKINGDLTSNDVASVDSGRGDTDPTKTTVDLYPNGSSGNKPSSFSKKNGEDGSATVQYYRSVIGSGNVSPASSFDNTASNDIDGAPSRKTVKKAHPPPGKFSKEEDIELLALKYFRTVCGQETASPASSGKPLYPPSPSSWGTPLYNGEKEDDTVTTASSSSSSTRISNKQEKREQKVLTRQNVTD